MRPLVDEAARLCDADVERIARRVVELLRTAPDAPTLLDARGAARRLNMSRATFDRRVRPYVAAVDTGGHLRYRPADLDEWSASRSRAVSPRGVTPRPRLRRVGEGASP